MASTGAVLYVRPRITGAMSAGRATEATLYFPLRALSGLITDSSGVASSRNLTNLSTLLPHITQPIVVVGRDGKMTCDPQWYRFFDFLTNTFLGGLQGATLADAIASIVALQTVASNAELRTQLLSSQAQTNAEALSAAVQVVQVAALPGAEQIPPVKLSGIEP